LEARLSESACASPRRPGVFVTWAPVSRRTQTLAARLGLEQARVSAPWFKRPLFAPLKYPVQIARTWQLLRRVRPAEVWVMDPPAPAVLVAWAYCRLEPATQVVDMHTVGFYDLKWRVLRLLEWPALRDAAVNLVTNRRLADRLRSWHCRAAVLTDPLPTPPEDIDDPVEKGAVTVVATYSADEPIHELPSVARSLSEVTMYVTGHPLVDTSRWPHNLVPTGFLDDAEYWHRLASSEVVVVLTTRPDTLLSGGYEALAVGRPVVVSGQAVLRERFGDAAVYVSDDADGIAAGIRVALAAADDYAARSRRLAVRWEDEWQKSAAQLLRSLGGSL